MVSSSEARFIHAIMDEAAGLLFLDDRGEDKGGCVRFQFVVKNS